MPDILLQLSPCCHICRSRRARRIPAASGYSRAMHMSLLFTLAVGTGGVALAQSVPPAAPDRDAAAEMSSAQRRMELRTVLSAGRNAEAPAPAPAPDAGPAGPAGPAGRQLSRQQRLEIREQLRQFQPQAARPRRP